MITFSAGHHFNLEVYPRHSAGRGKNAMRSASRVFLKAMAGRPLLLQTPGHYSVFMI